MKKIFSILLVFFLLFSLFLPTQKYSASNSNNEDIKFLVEKGVIENAASCVVANIVTREQVAVMISKALKLDGTQRDTKFTDVPKSNINSGYIQSAVEAGIINGYNDGTFKPNAQVTRGHMVAFIARAFDLPAGNKTFKDVPANHTAYEAVKQLAAANITTGYSDGTFKPEGSLTCAHIVAFVSRAIRYQETGVAIPTPIPSPAPTPSPEPDLSSGTYVIPGAPTSFKNCSALNEYYPYGVKKGHPAYADKMDRDKDGWACEK